MNWRWLLVGALCAAACEDDGDRLGRQDCEAVIAHLVVLEKLAEEGSDGPMCKYHDACDGSQRKRWLKECPRVLSKKEAHCYQRATSISSADACLSRVDLDERIQSGDADRGGSSYGGGGGWLGGGGGSAGGGAPSALMRDLQQLKQDACACKDADCARQIEDRFSSFSRRYNDVKDPQLASEVEKIAADAMTCLGNVISMAPADAGLDAAAPSGLPSCDRYADVMNQYVACDKIPQAARDAAKEGLDAMRQGWADTAGMSDDTRRMYDDACNQAIDAIKQSATAMGCSIY